MVFVVSCRDTVCNNNCFDIFAAFTVCNKGIAASVCEECADCTCCNSICKAFFCIVNTECHNVFIKVVVTVCASLLVIFLAVFGRVSCLFIELFIAAGHVNFGNYACGRNLHACNTYIACNTVCSGELSCIECKIVVNFFGCNILEHAASVVNVLHLGGLECVCFNIAFLCDSLHKICCLTKLCFCVVVCDKYIVAACNTGCNCGVCNLALVVKIECTIVACLEVFCKCGRKLICFFVYNIFAFRIVNLINKALYNITGNINSNNASGCVKACNCVAYFNGACLNFLAVLDNLDKKFIVFVVKLKLAFFAFEIVYIVVFFNFCNNKFNALRLVKHINKNEVVFLIAVVVNKCHYIEIVKIFCDGVVYDSTVNNHCHVSVKLKLCKALVCNALCIADNCFVTAGSMELILCNFNLVVSGRIHCDCENCVLAGVSVFANISCDSSTEVVTCSFEATLVKFNNIALVIECTACALFQGVNICNFELNKLVAARECFTCEVCVNNNGVNLFNFKVVA